MIMKKYTSPLECNNYYHVYNHAVGKDNLFKNNGNYIYFLKKYAKYISPVADTFAYCLLPNHFHIALRIKDEQQIENTIKTDLKIKSTNKLDYKKYISKQFSNLFSSYTQAFNRQNERTGTLFERPFKRLHIDSNNYFREIIHYIHFNPVHHGFVEDLRDWKYSSFESFFSEKATLLKRAEVIDWFNNKEDFYTFHKKEIKEKAIIDLEL